MLLFLLSLLSAPDARAAGPARAPRAGAAHQEYAGAEIALRFGHRSLDPGVGLVVRAGVAPGESVVEVGGWADLRLFLRSEVEVGGGAMFGVGSIDYTDGGYYPVAMVVGRFGASVSTRWGPGLRGGAQLRAGAVTLDGEATYLLGRSWDRAPQLAFPTVAASLVVFGHRAQVSLP
jgi:hypothetical protein